MWLAVGPNHNSCRYSCEWGWLPPWEEGDYNQPRTPAGYGRVAAALEGCQLGGAALGRKGLQGNAGVGVSGGSKVDGKCFEMAPASAGPA